MTEITDEQRAAVEWLQRAADPNAWQLQRPYLTLQRAQALLATLPSELTNPQPELPTQPGRYQDGTGDDKWKLESDGTWHYNSGRSLALVEVSDHGPFTRLVPERPQITREHVIAVFDSYGDNCDLETINDLVDLANGTYRD